MIYITSFDHPLWHTAWVSGDLAAHSLSRSSIHEPPFQSCPAFGGAIQSVPIFKCNLHAIFSAVIRREQLRSPDPQKASLRKERIQQRKPGDCTSRFGFGARASLAISLIELGLDWNALRPKVVRYGGICFIRGIATGYCVSRLK